MIHFIFLTLALLTAACGFTEQSVDRVKGAIDGSQENPKKEENAQPKPQPPGEVEQDNPLKLTAGLTTFASCSEAEQHIEDRLMRLSDN